MTQYEPVIGLEIHVELATNSKMFCGCPADHFGKVPNTQTCPVCLAMPGGLPVPNKKAIEWTIKLGLALGCDIPLFSKFDRKNYFYPDLPKGYQISQYDQPFAINGLLKTAFGSVRIRRVHLEEDTGKLLHTIIDGKKVTLVDFNRSGVPLVEIVTEPDIHSGDQAKLFLKKLHQIVRYLDISSADMEKGSMRLEPNISVRKIGEEELPTYKVEVKNINSFNFVKKAIDFEVSRHIELLEKGEIPKQETRGYIEATSSTISQRSKEEAADYRYFPDPDIPPIRLTDEQIHQIRKELPELPDEKRKRFEKIYCLSEQDAIGCAETKSLANYFEQCVALSKEQKEATMITPTAIARKIINAPKNTNPPSPLQVVQNLISEEQKKLIDPNVLIQAVETVISEQTKAVTDYKNGKTNVFMFLVGMVKRQLQGKGDAKQIEEELRHRIG